jgi:hypothetical protein
MDYWIQLNPFIWLIGRIPIQTSTRKVAGPGRIGSDKNPDKKSFGKLISGKLKIDDIQIG